jgi:hypothetical protein
MCEATLDFLIDSLFNWTALLLAGMFLIVAAGMAVALAAYFFRRTAARHNINATFEWHGGENSPGPTTVRGVWEDVANKIKIAISNADSDVHVLDKKAVATAKRMAADGASLDDICRATERNFPDWDEPRQDAFRRVMKTMFEDAG